MKQKLQHTLNFKFVFLFLIFHLPPIFFAHDKPSKDTSDNMVSVKYNSRYFKTDLLKGFFT